jgi:hypothetical protein
LKGGAEGIYGTKIARIFTVNGSCGSTIDRAKGKNTIIFLGTSPPCKCGGFILSLFFPWALQGGLDPSETKFDYRGGGGSI